MKASLPRTLFIMFFSVVYVLEVSIRAIIKSTLGTLTRAWCDKTMLEWSKRILALVNAHYHVYNPHQVYPKLGQPTIIVCNHSSHYDIPLTFVAFPGLSLRMLAKKELARLPIWGRALRAAEFPFIDRQNRTKAIENLAYVQSLLKSGIVIWMAPEGTRTQTGELAAFKKGAFITAIQTQATIIPIVIRGANQILPARTWHFQLNRHPEIHIAAPIDASEYTIENKQILIDRVFNTMHELLNPPPQ